MTAVEPVVKVAVIEGFKSCRSVALAMGVSVGTIHRWFFDDDHWPPEDQVVALEVLFGRPREELFSRYGAEPVVLGVVDRDSPLTGEHQPVRQVMAARGLTQKELARRMHFTQAGVGYWTLGQRRPYVFQLVLLSHLLEAAPWELFDWIEPPGERAQGPRLQPTETPDPLTHEADRQTAPKETRGDGDGRA